jgi:hypothetical protein
MNPLPTPEELLDAPELAVLAALRTTLDAAAATLVSVHPDLYSPDHSVPDSVFPGSSATVGTLLTLIQALSGQIDLYRRLSDWARTVRFQGALESF